jgi:hypothetical protein
MFFLREIFLIFTQEKFPRTENFPKISLLKVENFQLQNFFSDGKFVSANHILQNVLSAGNFPELKWALSVYLLDYLQKCFYVFFPCL